MLPVDIHISPEGKQHAIGLREIDLISCFGIQESQLSGLAEGHTHRDVLVPSTLWVESRAIVVEWLPVSGVCVPVESGTHALHLDVEVVSNLLLDHLESR